ncbi:MAG: c-type cytochrome [Caulobacteraceae bacterium]
MPAGFMKPMVASLSQKDMIDLAAYVGSLKP